MLDHEYATMAAFESSYWWYRGMHGALLDLLRAYVPDRAARILDAGCGTGGNLTRLSPHYSDLSGFDYAREAVPFWARHGLRRLCIASINDMPYPDNAFDAVLSIDVLETQTVDVERAIAEMWRVTRPGGILVVVVPAFRWLYSEEHERAVNAGRRYTRREVIALLQAHPVEIIRASYFFMLMFPLIFGARLLERLRPLPANAEPRSALKPLPGIINAAFTAIMRVERGLFRGFNLPVGSSVLVVGRKHV